MRHRSGLLLTLSALALVSITTPAAADPIDVPAATLQNSVDQANAALAFSAYAAQSSLDSTYSPDNVTCSKPVVYGAELIPHADAIFAETHQTDQAFATAQCANLSGAWFQASIEIEIEYCVRISILACSFTRTGFGDRATADSIFGVAAPRVTLLAVYPDTHAALGKIRRVFACVRVVGRTGCQTHDYSGTYGV